MAVSAETILGLCTAFRVPEINVDVNNCNLSYEFQELEVIRGNSSPCFCFMDLPTDKCDSIDNLINALSGKLFNGFSFK